MLHGTFVLCGTKNYLFSCLQEQQRELKKKIDELAAKFNKITLPSVPKHLQPRSKQNTEHAQYLIAHHTPHMPVHLHIRPHQIYHQCKNENETSRKGGENLRHLVDSKTAKFIIFLTVHVIDLCACKFSRQRTPENMISTDICLRSE